MICLFSWLTACKILNTHISLAMLVVLEKWQCLEFTGIWQLQQFTYSTEKSKIFCNIPAVHNCITCWSQKNWYCSWQSSLIIQNTTKESQKPQHFETINWCNLYGLHARKLGSTFKSSKQKLFLKLVFSLQKICTISSSWYRPKQQRCILSINFLKTDFKMYVLCHNQSLINANYWYLHWGFSHN
jgi:hypothetical protein